jgi:adenosine 3'-phospho 5'-phosphosulfate transporter B3
MTSVRKAITIVLSFVIFAKPFTVWYILGGLLVFAGLFTNLFASRDSKKDTEEKARLESEWSNGQKVHDV